MRRGTARWVVDWEAPVTPGPERSGGPDAVCWWLVQSDDIRVVAPFVPHSAPSPARVGSATAPAPNEPTAWRNRKSRLGTFRNIFDAPAQNEAKSGQSR